MVRALNDGVLSLKDRDFSMSVTCTTRDELGELVTNYNGLGDRLRVERQSLYQRELMLDTVIQATPLALVLTNDCRRGGVQQLERPPALRRGPQARRRPVRALPGAARQRRCGKPSIAAATPCSRSRSAGSPRSITFRSAASCSTRSRIAC